MSLSWNFANAVIQGKNECKPLDECLFLHGVIYISVRFVCLCHPNWVEKQLTALEEVVKGLDRGVGTDVVDQSVHKPSVSIVA